VVSGPICCRDQEEANGAGNPGVTKVRASPRVGAKGGTEVQKIRVLIVDDCSIARDGIRSILKAFPDIEVVGEAANGLEAIAQAEHLQPTVVLMDVQMPEMDGIEAIGPIKQRMSRTNREIISKTSD